MTQMLDLVDVTGTWQSSDYIFIELTLEQRGQKVTGSVLKPKQFSGPIEGTVTGDELSFQRKGGIFEGRMTVNGDEMSGTLRAIVGSAYPGFARETPVRFQRVSSGSRPSSQP